MIRTAITGLLATTAAIGGAFGIGAANAHTAHAQSNTGASAPAAAPAGGARSSVATVASPSHRVLDVSDYSYVAFASPSGNLACQITGGDQGDSSAVTCNLPHSGAVHDTIPSTHKACSKDSWEYADLEAVQLYNRLVRWDCADEMQVFPVSDPQAGSYQEQTVRWAIAHHMPSTYSPTYHASVAELPYGTTLRHGSIRVTSTRSGLVIRDGRHGFTISRSAITPSGQSTIAQG